MDLGWLVVPVEPKWLRGQPVTAVDPFESVDAFRAARCRLAA